jgi:peptidoglycan/xylan/chitin deacetylase (PgdA/CDA1 family)
MYHKVSPIDNKDALTVTAAQFEKHLQIIKTRGYNTVSLEDLRNYITHKINLPPKPLLLTFDDGYKNNYTVAYPLLEKYQMKAGIFLITSLLQTGYDDNTKMSQEYLHIKDVERMDPEIISFGLHTNDHRSYNNLSIGEIDFDIKRCKHSLQSLRVNFQPCLAYPYGAYSKKDVGKKTKIFELLKLNNIEFAFRIGNRINSLPIKNKFLIHRIDIRGDEPLWKFKIALNMGRKIFLQ